MYFIYVFYLKSPLPLISDPLCIFCNQVLHMWYTVCLPGFVPTPHMYKIKIKTAHSKQLKYSRVAQLVPVFVSTNTVGQLDVPWLTCVPLGMDCEEVGIFHHAHQVALCCLMKGIHGSLGPMWAECLFSFCLGQFCGVDFCLPSPSPPFTHTDVLD